MEMEQNNETFWPIFVYYTLQYLWRLFVAVVTAPRSFLLRPSGYFRRFASVVQEWAKKPVINFYCTVHYTSKSFSKLLFLIPREVQLKKIYISWQSMVFWDSVPRCLYKMPSRKMHHYTPYLLCVFNLLLVLTYHVHSFIHCCIHRTNNSQDDINDVLFFT